MDLGNIVLVLLFVLFVGYFIARVLGAIWYGFGGEPPLWMIDDPVIGVQSRSFSAFIGVWILFIILLIVGIIFELPFLTESKPDPIDSPETSSLILEVENV
jgi:hypothetical protein